MSAPEHMFEAGLHRRPANHTPLTPLSFLLRAARAFPDQPAIVHGRRRDSYATFYERCVRLASALAGLGVGRGDTVAIMAPNIPAVLEANFGVPMLGAVLNSINIRLEPTTVAAILEHGAAKVVLVDRDCVPVLRAAIDRLERPAPVVVDIEDELAEGGAPFGGPALEDVLAGGDPGFAWPGVDDEWQAIALNYTSGTTADPKGVVYHHRGAYLAAMSNIPALNLRLHASYLWTLPMFHTNGWSNCWTTTAVAGVNVCLRKVEPAEIFRLIDAHQVTHMSGAPVILNMLVNAPDGVRRRSCHPIELTVGAAAPPGAVLQKIEAMGFRITHGYGLTESYGPASTCAWHEEWDALDLDARTAKMARQGVHTWSLDDMIVGDPQTCAPVPRDGATVGEILLRGNSVMKGYLRNPDANETAFAGGWFHTGDLAVWDPDGYVLIRDRAKDIIISGGENISSIEVEAALYKHPAVLEAAVVATPDDTWGETPCAFVTLKDGAEASPEELTSFLRDEIAHFKVPRAFVFGPLPKTATGKVQKHRLRERARAGV